MILSWGLGLLFLLAGAQALERGAVTLAARLELPRFVIGLTLVALTTSLPEIVVASGGVLAGFPGLAVGTIVGSNSLNILIVLGLAALVRPLTVDKRALGWEGLIMLAAAGVLTGLLAGDTISRSTGLVLLVGLLAYSGLVVTLEYKAAHAGSQFRRVPPVRQSGVPLALAILMILGGMIALFLGAKFLIEASAGLAYDLGLSETVLGLFILAGFTSLPELATVLTAAWRGHPGIAVGTIIGSNIFNTLGALGASGLLGTLEVPGDLTNLDLGVHIAASLVLFLFAFTGLRFSRLEGLILIAAYAGYALWRLGGV